MKARLLLLVLLLLAVGVVIWRADRQPRADTQRIETKSEQAEPPAPAGQPEPEPMAVESRPPQGGVATTRDTANGVEAELESVKFLVRDFRAALGENPVGNNAEITKALMGANRKKTRFLDTGVFQLNDKGELVDHWGTPYFFHQISGKEMEIRSAGPDKRMWTDDDLIIH